MFFFVLISLDLDFDLLFTFFLFGVTDDFDFSFDDFDIIEFYDLFEDTSDKLGTVIIFLTAKLLIFLVSLILYSS